MSEKKYLLFIDAETDGLYGDFLSVAAKVIDKKTFEEIDCLYVGIKKDKMVITDKWVYENVYPYLGDYDDSVNNEEELFERIWKFYEKYDYECDVIADVAYPVEYRLFEKCVLLNYEKRKMKAPFPFLDLGSMLYEKGIDIEKDREELLDVLPNGNKHNALYDINVSIEIYKKYIKKGMDSNQKNTHI